MISLIDVLESTGEEVVVVVGLAKNSGKTTTVNHLIGAYDKLGLRLGLTSIGRDGEPVDLITRRPKPRIRVEVGTLAVTAQASLAESPIPARVIARMDIPSALGEQLLIEAEGSGQIELSGPTTMAETRKAISLLKESGARRVIVDGALDRLSSSSPSLCGAVILSSGAVLGTSVQSVADRVAHQVTLFGLPVISGNGAESVIDTAKRRGRLAAIIADDGRIADLDGSALTCHGLTEAVGRDSRWLWAGGGVTDTIVDDLLKSPAIPDIVVEDATRIFLSRMTYARWRMAGGRIWVLSATRLVAVTTNPARPNGQGMDAKELLEGVARSVPGIPVYDVVAELATRQDVVDRPVG